MGTKHKPPEELNAMVEHIRYEVIQILNMMNIGNEWCPEVLSEGVAGFTESGILEAGLIHFRCVIEFLGEQPIKDQVVARDYLRVWDWKITDELQHIRDLHGRLAHLGTIRIPGDFNWLPWLTERAPVVLRGFRQFLLQLQAESPN